MKRNLLLIIYLLCCLLAGAQKWEWARQTNTRGSQSWGKQVSCDGEGNVYVLGACSRQVSLGNFNVDSGSFLVKYNPAGEVLWAKDYELSGNNYYNMDMYNDRQGNLIIYGTYTNVLATGNSTLTIHGAQDMFIIKLNSNGEELWAESIGSARWDGGHVCSDKNGFTYIAGVFQGDSIYCGQNMQMVPPARGKIMIAKLDQSGNLLWTTRGLQLNDTVYFYYASACAVNKDDELIVYGMMSALGHEPYAALMTARLDLEGNLKSWHSLSINPFYEPYSAVIDDSSYIYSTHDSGPHPGLGYLTKTDTAFNSAGRFFIGGQYNCYWLGNIQADGTGNSYLNGFMFYDSTFRGCTHVHDQVIVFKDTFQVNGSNILLAKFDRNGNLSWLKSAGGRGYHPLNDTYAGKDGNIYVTGSFGANGDNGYPTLHGNMLFDEIELQEDSTGNTLYVAKLNGNAAVQSTRELTITNFRYSIYPNPSKDGFFISNASNERIRVFNSFGELIRQENYSPKGIIIKDRSSGIYLVEISNDSSLHTFKLIME